MIRNKLYPYIEKYINDYLYGFTKEQMNLAITEGKLELNCIMLRPDVINKIMDDSNVPFWLKAGLINKIYVGCSLMNLIAEIPLEITIEEIDIILSPSSKWINLHLESSLNEFIKKNPIGIDLNLNNNENLENLFDTSIFNKTYNEEIFKDKSLVSNLVNSMLKSLYDFYNLINFAVILKINKIRLRIEDDELFNYEGKFVLGIKIDNITAKMGFKGDQKKNSLKISNFSVYWECEPKIIITNEFLTKSMIGEMKDEYYNQIREINFNVIDDNTTNNNIKNIIDNFSISINFGTIKDESNNSDIFNIQNDRKKCYFQISSNELVINIYPEFLKAINHLSSFSGNFPLIEKIKDYRPHEKPYKNTGHEINKDQKKEIVKDWLNYIVWKNKFMKKRDVLIENPFREEFNRFYNIYHKKVDVFQLLEKIKENKEKEKENNNTDNKEKEKEKEKEKINNENEINDINKESNEKKETPISGYYEEIFSYEEYVLKNGGDKNSNITKENYNKYLDDIVKKKYEYFSSSIEILLKGFIINLHPSLNRSVDINNRIIINTYGIEIKLEITPKQFNFDFGITSLDIGPSDLIYGERIILCPTSYRSNFPGLYANNNSIIITPNNSDINNVHEQEKREAGINGLIKKYNPNHDQKVKIIDEALNKIKDEPRSDFNIKLYNSDYLNTTLRGKPNNNLLSSNFSVNANNFKGLRRSNVSCIGSGEKISGLAKSRNSSFAKSIIDNYNVTDLRLKNQLKKQKNELNISQAINNYNTNNNQRKNTPLNNSRYSNFSNFNLMNSSISSFKLKSVNKFVYKPIRNYTKNNSPPLNFIEIYSNSKIGALKMKYTKFNNTFSLDDFSIQLGTIRLHPFPQYLIDMITIFLDYKKDQNKPQFVRSQIKSVDGGGIEGTKNLLKMRQLFYEILSEIPNEEKTESIKEYMNHLKKETQKLLRFEEGIDPFFEINYLFSFFPKGIKFYIDYESIECVYYNKMEKVLGKFMISPLNINISISFTKIIANFLGVNIEINNLKESKELMEKLLEKCTKMLNNKKDMIEIIIEPCYDAIKNELIKEGIFDESIIANINDLQKSFVKKSVNKLPIVKKKKK